MHKNISSFAGDILVSDLVNCNALWLLDLFLLEGDSENAIFENSFNAVFDNLDRKCDSAAEFTPVAFLNVPLCSFFIFAAAKDARNGQDVV